MNTRIMILSNIDRLFAQSNYDNNSRSAIVGYFPSAKRIQEGAIQKIEIIITANIRYILIRCTWWSWEQL